MMVVIIAENDGVAVICHCNVSLMCLLGTEVGK